METKRYDTLPAEAMDIRKEVFMEEQGFQNEFDEIDRRAVHLVLFDGEMPVGTCRVFRDEATGRDTVGRIAVRKPWRGKACGARLLGEAEGLVRQQGGRQLCLHAQVAAKGFYEKQGYQPWGEEDLDEGCPHVWMKKELEG